MGFKDLYHLARDLFTGGIAGFSKRWAKINANVQYKHLNRSRSILTPIDKMDWHLFTASALVISALLWLCFLPMILMNSGSGLTHFQKNLHLSNYSSSLPYSIPMEKQAVPLPQTRWKQQFQSNPVPINLSEIKKQIGLKQIARITGLKGKVIAKVLVDKKGKYRNHYMVRSDHNFLRAVVEQKIDQLTFTPGRSCGYPTARFAYVSFDFHE